MICHESGFRTDDVNRRMGRRPRGSATRRVGSLSWMVAVPAIARLYQPENPYSHGPPLDASAPGEDGEPDRGSGSQRQGLGQRTKSTVTTHQMTVSAE